MSTATAPTSCAPPAPLDNGDVLYEVIDGQRVEKHVSKLSTLVANEMGRHLSNFGVPNKIGIAIVEGLVRLRPGGNQYRPDVMFIPYDRWLEDVVTDEEPWELVPKLMVEVDSPTNVSRKMMDKVDDYFNAGVPMVWVVYPDKRRI
jgi:Uma2 family endonuclease